MARHGMARHGMAQQVMRVCMQPNGWNTRMHGWLNLAMQAGTGAWLLAPLKMSANSGRRHSWGSRPTSRATAPLQESSARPQ